MSEKASILIVDDNISLCETMSLILQERGYDVFTAGGGPEALEKVRDCSIDVIFLDIKMPLMGGVETCKRIKCVSPEVVVVLMTAYSLEEMVQEGLLEGAYGVLYKPLDMDRVLHLVDEIVARKRKSPRDQG